MGRMGSKAGVEVRVQPHGAVAEVLGLASEGGFCILVLIEVFMNCAFLFYRCYLCCMFVLDSCYRQCLYHC